jgi:hypothetical protein
VRATIVAVDAGHGFCCAAIAAWKVVLVRADETESGQQFSRDDPSAFSDKSVGKSILHQEHVKDSGIYRDFQYACNLFLTLHSSGRLCVA